MWGGTIWSDLVGRAASQRLALFLIFRHPAFDSSSDTCITMNLNVLGKQCLM